MFFKEAIVTTQEINKECYKKTNEDSTKENGSNMTENIYN